MDPKTILPVKGEQITITLSNLRSPMKTGPLAKLIPDTFDVVGILNSDLQSNNTFSVVVGGSHVPVRVISLDRVLMINGKKVRALATATPNVFLIDGSKGAKYTVKFDGKNWSCNCTAGSFGRACKHIREARDIVEK